VYVGKAKGILRGRLEGMGGERGDVRGR